MRLRGVAVLIAGALLAFGSSARAATIALSTISSDGTPASQLDATVDIAVGDFDLGNPGDELKLTLTNPAAIDGGDALFNINGVWWNAVSSVTGLTLLSATHSAAGDVYAAWTPVENSTMVNGFGTFRFGLTDGTGETNPNILMPGESVEFIMSITGTGPFTDASFVVANSMGLTAAAKFVNGPPDPECAGVSGPTAMCPQGTATEDSAYGAVPEPGTASLLALGLLSFAFGRKALRA